MAKVIVPKNYNVHGGEHTVNYEMLHTSNSTASVSLNIIDGIFAYQDGSLMTEFTFIGTATSVNIYSGASPLYFNIIIEDPYWFGIRSYRYVIFNFKNLPTYTNNDSVSKTIYFYLRNTDKNGTLTTKPLNFFNIAPNGSISPSDFSILYDTVNDTITDITNTRYTNLGCNKAVVPNNYYVKSDTQLDPGHLATEATVEISNDAEKIKIPRYLGLAKTISWTRANTTLAEAPTVNDIVITINNTYPGNYLTLPCRFLKLSIFNTPQLRNPHTALTVTKSLKAKIGDTSITLSQMRLNPNTATLNSWADCVYWIDLKYKTLIHSEVIDRVGARKVITTL